MTRRAVAIVQQGHKWMDRQWKALLELNAEMPLQGHAKVDVACRKGCAACCTYLVDVLDSEGELIAMAIEQTGGESKAVALARLHAWEAEYLAFEIEYPKPDSFLVTLDNETGQLKPAVNPAHQLWRARWQARRKACPMLNLEDNSCGAYEQRPATCRGHHAAYPPADASVNCAQPPEGCFTTDADVARGSLQPIYQINNMLGEDWTMALAEQLAKNGESWKPGNILPIEVLAHGRRLYNWPRPRGAQPPVEMVDVAYREPIRVSV